jgi:UDP-N-acetylmuramate dehydrogenase
MWTGIQGSIYANRPLAPLTTWKIGGAAAYLAAPAGLEEVFALMRCAQERGWPLWFLGRGSNVLIADTGLPGVTLHLARSAMRQGFAGFEFLSGIPGTVGAAVRLNAGAHGGSLAQVLSRVWVATPQLKLLELKVEELGLGYRTSMLLNFPHWLVVEAEFNLTTPAAPETVARRMQELLALRRERLPSNPRSCGSVFRNPPEGPPAGLLIEAAGFKGRRRGQALVSRKHANFILNSGGARAAQVKALIAEIQEQVWRTQGVALEREVVFLPDDLG